MRRYKSRNVSLEPTVDALVLAEANRRGIAYSTALNSIVLGNGHAAGMAISTARQSIATARRRLEIMIGNLQSGRGVRVEESQELLAMLVAAGESLQ